MEREPSGEEPGPSSSPQGPPGFLHRAQLQSKKKKAKEERQHHPKKRRLEWISTGTVYRPPPSRDLHHRLLKLESEKKTAEEECERLRHRLSMPEWEKKAAKEKEEERRRLIERLYLLEFDPAVRPTFESNPMRKRSSSLDLLPPNLSELRVVLLGNSSSERMKVTDFLRSASEGVTGISSNDCWKYEFKIKERDVHFIDPKDLLVRKVSQAEVEEDVQTAQRLSAPGAHVLLLVLQPEDFTEDQKEKLCSVLRLFGERSFDHSLILISTPTEESPGFMEEFRKHPPLKDLIRMCKYRYLWFKDLEVEELLTRFDQIVKENDGEHLKP
ncbi:GTPase IMAP family member 2-like isoform 1-T2 [Menidia menidia]